MVQRAPAHVGERGDFDDATLEKPLHILGLDHVVERVVERAQVGHDLLLQVAGQKAKRLARLDRRAREDDAVDLLLFQSGHRHRHREVSFPRARRADSEGHVVLLNRLDIRALHRRLRHDGRTLCGALDFCDHERVECGRTCVLHGADGVVELELADGEPAFPSVFELAENLACQLDGGSIAFHAQPALAGGEFHPERALDELEVAEVVQEERPEGAGAFKFKRSLHFTEIRKPSPSACARGRTSRFLR